MKTQAAYLSAALDACPPADYTPVQLARLAIDLVLADAQQEAARLERCRANLVGALLRSKPTAP